MALQLPPDAGNAREQAIRTLIAQGNYEVTWATVTASHGGHTAEFQVFADALKIEGVRINVSAETEQIIADTIGCMMLTPRLADLVWLQRAVTLPPFPRPITASTAAMIEHSQKIDAALVKLGNPSGLIATVGKHWCIDNDLQTHPGKAENYGWHVAAPMPGIPMEVTASQDANGHYMQIIQGRGWAHDMHHVDYSQTCVLVAKGCKVDGQDMTLADLLKDPSLAPLASHQGVLHVLRQPGVPEPASPNVVLPEVQIDVDPSSPEDGTPNA